MHHRLVNQAERYRTAEMELLGGSHRAAIPAAYTSSEFPLQYYFEVGHGRGQAGLYQGFTPDLTNQPHFVVRRHARHSMSQKKVDRSADE